MTNPASWHRMNQCPGDGIGLTACHAHVRGLTLGGTGKAGTREAKEEPDQAPWMDRLMDVLLSLLARPAAALPSAPLRDAVEAVFRAFAPHLTPGGAHAGSAPPAPLRMLPLLACRLLSGSSRILRHSAQLSGGCRSLGASLARQSGT